MLIVHYEVHRESLSKCVEQIKTLAPILICSMKIFIQILTQGGKGSEEVNMGVLYTVEYSNTVHWRDPHTTIHLISIACISRPAIPRPLVHVNMIAGGEGAGTTGAGGKGQNWKEHYQTILSKSSNWSSAKIWRK